MPWLNDLRSACEVWGIAAILFWLIPRQIFYEKAPGNILLRFYSGFIRIVLLTVVAVFALSSLHVLSAPTLAVFYGSLLLLSSVRRIGMKKCAVLEWSVRRVAGIEERYRERGWKAAFGLRARMLPFSSGSATRPVVGVGLVVLLLVVQVRLRWPLHNLRCASPDCYIQLLKTRQLLYSTPNVSKLSVLPSILAVVTSLAAVDTMQVTRLMCPLMDIMLSAGVGVATAAILRSNWLGVLAAFAVGCYIDVSVVGARMTGGVFLLLAIAFFVEYWYHSHRNSLCDALCAALLVSLSPLRTFPREIALMILVCCAVSVIVRTFAPWVRASHTEALASVLLMLIAFGSNAPTYARPHFLEYESTARQTLRIINASPERPWAVVAPTEQFSETFGVGQYEDLSGFVGKYYSSVGDPSFNFPEQRLFVFVEKHPFQYFPTEPAGVSFSLLTDSTYRNYRSPAGRSSLELAAMKLCETYAAHHPSQIFFEDDDVRIYEFTRGAGKT